MKLIEIIFMYCNLISTRWQWSVDLDENRKKTAQKEKQYTKQYNNTEYTKWKTKTQNKKQRKRILKTRKSSNLKITKRNKYVIMI
jgi:hypothetical protein